MLFPPLFLWVPVPVPRGAQAAVLRRTTGFRAVAALLGGLFHTQSSSTPAFWISLTYFVRLSAPAANRQRSYEVTVPYIKPEFTGGLSIGSILAAPWPGCAPCHSLPDIGLGV